MSLDFTDFFSSSAPKEEDQEDQEDPQDQQDTQPDSSSSWWGTSGWSILNTVKEQSQSIINIYKEELTEFTKVIQNDTAEITKQAVSKLQDTLINPLESEEKTNSTPTKDQKNQVSASKSNKDIVLTRFQANLLSLQGDIATYCNEPVHLDDFQQWKTSFALNNLTDEITSLLAYNEKVRTLHSKLVPKVVSYADFWTRYYYRVHKLEQQEKRRADLLKRAQQKAPTEEEEFSWGDEESVDDDESGEESCQIEHNKQAKLSTQNQEIHNQSHDTHEPNTPQINEPINTHDQPHASQQVDQQDGAKLSPKLTSTHDQSHVVQPVRISSGQYDQPASQNEAQTESHIQVNQTSNIKDATGVVDQSTTEIKGHSVESHSEQELTHHEPIVSPVVEDSQPENPDTPLLDSADLSSTDLPTPTPDTSTSKTSTTDGTDIEDWGEWE